MTASRAKLPSADPITHKNRTIASAYDLWNLNKAGRLAVVQDATPISRVEAARLAFELRVGDAA